MGYQLGVDLGTTFTAAAIVKDGRPEVVTLGTRALEIPSVAFLRADGELLIGEPAERRASTEPGRVGREFKRRLGDPTPILLGGAPFSAHVLMSKLLRATVDVVTAREGGPPDAIVVTRPANWGEYKTELLDQAVQQADIGPVRSVPEPEAAAVFYSSTTRVAPGEVVAVYDLGGGTFDATVLRKTGDGFELLGSPTGIEQLGGVDFDEAVFAHVASRLSDQLNELDPDDEATVVALARLRRDCVDAKEALSSDTEVTIPVALPTLRTEIRLTRSEFEALIRPALLETLDTMKRALRSADIETEQLKAVVLVGGSSRIPLVAQLLGSELQRPVAIDVHPKHAVALGAAQIAASSVSAVQPSESLATESALASATPPPTTPMPAPVSDHAPKPGAKHRVPLLIGGAIGVIALLAVAAVALTSGGDDGSSADGATTTVSGEDETTSSIEVEPITIPEGPTLDTNTIAFTRVDGTFWNVWLIGADGGFTRALTNEIAVRAMLPEISANRRSVAYTVNNGDQWELWVADTNGEREQVVIDGLAPDAGATWSPDGTQIAFVSDRDGPKDIYILDLESGALRNLTNDDQEEGDPAWSPDGDRIAYWSRVGQNQDIYVRPIEGGDATRLTSADGEDADPGWHPDGGSLAFATQRDGDWEIYTMRDDGSGQQALTDNPAADQTPSWSPDGAFIVFESKRDAPDRPDTAELYVMLSSGGDQRRLTDFAGLDAEADWGPGTF